MNRTLATISFAATALLPNGWVITPSTGAVVQTQTLPLGAAPSPDGSTLAVVESGFNAPALRLYASNNLKEVASIPLKGAYGRPLWIDASHVLVAGANADAVLDVDVNYERVSAIGLAKGSYPIAVASCGAKIAVATEGDRSVRVGSLAEIAAVRPVRTGESVGLACTADGRTLYASDAGGRRITAIDTASRSARSIATGLHPGALLIANNTLYVAETDADTVALYDAATGGSQGAVYVGDFPADRSAVGVSPNALSAQGDTLYVSLAAANEIAVIRNRAVVARIPAGWYPTDAVPLGGKLYIVDGKGEGTRPNPRFDPRSESNVDYVAAIQFGSIRAYDLSADSAAGNPQGATGWTAAQTSGVVRANGPIRHVFFILKENRSYDQVLGDMPQGNGDPKLTWFGAKVTPNEHAIAARFGLFDNTYTSGEVSESGHNWSDAAFDTDWVERMWPATYNGRRTVDDDGWPETIPHSGYIWQAAGAAHVSFRDYGEMVEPNAPKPGQHPAPSVAAEYDPKYIGWNLAYSDLSRVKEWRREFEHFLHAGNLPQLEYIWLPNDHTFGSRKGQPTPVAMVAQNDYALGQIVQTISHSKVWRSSAIFVIEDDSQDGPDHVSGQRTTFFLISPYARGGLQHDHYSTVSVLRTMEMLLGIPPLSAYDAMAVSMRAAFSDTPHVQPFDAIGPRVSLAAVNRPGAYGALLSAQLDFSQPDATTPGAMLQILAHNH
ncbi:MAG TPA: alkaline phosphatase family protein [Candidatus Cybelea sp.]|nr:alkaline phosphatase family protein [Candidatus Cybelea sp.]